MRIIAGKYRGKIICYPPADITRPTSDRAREALFSSLEARLMAMGKNWQDINFLDVFAGSGACGLEALSRGAKYALFIEKAKEAELCIRKNIALLKAENMADIYTDVFNLSFAKSAFDIVFLDAPYNKGLSGKALETLYSKGWISDKTICIVEMEKNEKIIFPSCFILEKIKNYGRASIHFLKCESEK